MGLARVYIKPFNADGTYADDFIDVTKDIFKIGTSKLDADSLDFQLGAYKTSSVQVSANNRSGRFADVDQAESIFKYKRANSIVKITWSHEPEPLIAGFFQAGNAILGGEEETFEGLLSDQSLFEESSTETVDFQVLGYESIFDQVQVPFSSLSLGMLASQIIYTLLNQSPITTLMVVDPANITPGTDLAPDVLDSLNNQTVTEAVNEILKCSNSVLYVSNGVVYVKQRTPTASVSQTFYGQASQNGIENVIDVTNITGGLPRLYNFFNWDADGATAVQKDLPSIRKNGLFKYAFKSDLFTDTAKQNRILADLLAEFKDPKKECELKTRLTYDSLALNILDRVSVDYPTVFVPTEGFSLPVCGVAVCGSSDQGPTGAVLPLGLWSLTIDKNDQFKILAKEIDVIAETIVFKLRKI